MKSIFGFLGSLCLLLLSMTLGHAQEIADNPYYLRYGDEGVERFIYFSHVLDKKPKPLTVHETPYVAPPIIDGIVQVTASEHGVCVRGTEHSLTGKNIEETYEVPYKGKKYKIKVVRDFCSKRGYDVATKKLNGIEEDEGSYSKMNVFVNGKQTLALNFTGEVVGYGFDKSELITEVFECCNADNYYNRHDWLKGKMLESDILHINADDVPQLKSQKGIEDSDEKAKDVFGGFPNGESGE